jgi:hypothetical protein
MKKNSYSSIYSRAKTPSNPIKNSANKPSNEKNEIPIIDLLKCPICKNICLMTINRDKLLFSFECNNKHKNNNLKKSKTYFNSGNKIFNSNISDLNISHEKELKFTNKDNNTSNYTNNSKKNNNFGHNIYITEKDFSCPKHNNLKYQSYCYDCKENICIECNKEHISHNQIKLDTLKPKDNEVVICKNNIKKRDEELNNIIEHIVKWKKEFEYGLSTIIKIMQNISNLRQFIIMNYDSKQSNHNYNYLQNFNNMKVLDFIFPELQEFIKEKNWKKRGHILIEIIINIQHKIIENKEKLKIMKLKEEIDKKTEILKKKLEFQDKNENNGKNILKSNKNGMINQEENEDIGSVETSNSNLKKIKNFNTTFSSDCMNNNYFCRDVSRKVKHTKKQIIAKRNKNRNDNTLSHTIEQNKELEKNLNAENTLKNDEYNDIDMDQSINLDPKLIKVVETKNKTFVDNNNNSATENNNNIQNVNNTFSIMDANNSNKNNENSVENKNNSENIGNNDEINNRNENKKENDNIMKKSTGENYNNNSIKDNIENNNKDNIENNSIKDNVENNNKDNIENNNNDNIEDNYDKDNIEEIDNKRDNIEDKENNIDENKDNKENENNEQNNNEKIEQIEVKKETVENVQNVNESINDMEIQNDNCNNANLKNKNINKINNKIKEKKIYKNIELKYELINTDIIRSIEFIKNNYILICTLENIAIYKINPNFELVKEYDIKEFNYRINYATQISNNYLVICSLNNIDIIQLSESPDQSMSYNLIQKLTGKNNSYNINKVIEIKEKDYLISCDKNNLIIFAKNKETNLYQEHQSISTNSEVKCLEEINENIFVTVEPEEQCVIFYKTDNMENTYVINNIQSSFGRYVISYIDKFNCIFVTGRQGIYLISTEKYELITFFQVKEWISSIHYDFYNDYLMCGTWKKNTVNGQKIYNLILYEVVEDNSNEEKKLLDNMIIREVERKNNIHIHDIVVIKPSEEGFILTGSNDRTVKIWN